MSQDTVIAILENGLTNFINVTGDKSLRKFAAFALRPIQNVFSENIKADDTCLFAFPGMVVLPDIRVECFVAILKDRVIVAWRKGIFKKTTCSRIIPKSTLKEASWAVSKNPVTRGATLLTIIANETIDIALPKDKPDAANAILLAVQAT